MNQLAAYDSDEESPRRRRSNDDVPKNTAAEESTSSPAKQLDLKIRKNSDRWTASDEERERSSGESSSLSRQSDSESSLAMEPPPPKRFSPSPSDRSMHSDAGFSLPPPKRNPMPFTQSQTSLVSYGAQEDDEEDQFAKADKKAAAESKSRVSPPRSRSVTVEPKPPRGHQDSRSPDEIAVDSALEEGLRELRDNNVCTVESAVGSPNPSMMEGHESPRIEEEVTLPPSPTGACSIEAQEKFEKFFDRKAAGMSLNSMIQTRRDFKNPSIYKLLIEKFEMNELGSNFDRSVFDPHGFTEDCFYDNISSMQKEVMEKYSANAEKKAAAAAASGDQKAADAKRKSRFEGNKKHFIDQKPRQA